LVVIDMINDFLEKLEGPRRDQLVRGINDLVRMMRNASCPVIWIRQEFEPDLSDAFQEMRLKGIRAAIKGTVGGAALLDSPLWHDFSVI
jgi:nicotinamidase-related amidase